MESIGNKTKHTYTLHLQIIHSMYIEIANIFSSLEVPRLRALYIK